MHPGHTSPIFHLLYELVLALPDLFFVQVAAVLAEGFQLINVLIHVPHFSYLSEVQFWQLLPVLESPKRLTSAQLLPFSTANIDLLVAIALVITTTYEYVLGRSLGGRWVPGCEVHHGLIHYLVLSDVFYPAVVVLFIGLRWLYNFS